MTFKHIGLELKTYYRIQNPKFGISSKSVNDAMKQSDNSATKELSYEKGVKLTVKSNE